MSEPVIVGARAWARYGANCSRRRKPSPSCALSPADLQPKTYDNEAVPRTLAGLNYHDRDRRGCAFRSPDEDRK